MRSAVVLCLAVVVLAGRAHATRPVTVAELEQRLAGDRGLADGRVAAELEELTLTERVTAARLAAWEEEFPGRHTQQALLMLADESAFAASLPEEDVLAEARPSLEAQGAIFSSAFEYATRTMHNLPNFLALRETVHFEAPLRVVLEQAQEGAGAAAGVLGTPSLSMDAVNRLPLRAVKKASVVVTYRSGKEVRTGRERGGDLGLTTSGEFGPILGVVLGDAARGSIVWGYWQRQGEKRLAVFRYHVPEEQSHYLVQYGDMGLIQKHPAYGGEIAIDPATGSIFRISIVAEAAMSFGRVGSGMVVEYGWQELGNRRYLVPVHGVAISKAPVLPGFGQPRQAVTPVSVHLNDIEFTHYRLFRADARILSAEEMKEMGGGHRP